MSNPSQQPDRAVPARPIGALVLFLVLSGIVVGVLVAPIDGSNDCPGPLFASHYQYGDEVCGTRFDARMTWVQLLSIPTIVAGCATVSRWPRYFRSSTTAYLQ